MMGSPKMAIQIPLLCISAGVIGTYLSTDHGRKWYVKKTHEEKRPEARNFVGYNTRRGDSKTYFDEMDKLRKVNVHPVLEQKQASKID